MSFKLHTFNTNYNNDIDFKVEFAFISIGILHLTPHAKGWNNAEWNFLPGFTRLPTPRTKWTVYRRNKVAIRVKPPVYCKDVTASAENWDVYGIL